MPGMVIPLSTAPPRIVSDPSNALLSNFHAGAADALVAKAAQRTASTAKATPMALALLLILIISLRSNSA
jgi:hypothetical protein